MEERFLLAALLPGVRVVLELEHDARALGEAADGFDEGEVFVFLDEGEHVAALVAAEAVEDLAPRVDVEAGRFLAVEGAERDEVRSRALEGAEVTADDIHDVASRADFLEFLR